ncbi:MAG: SH3 domain-containing protein [Clostridia bacterium]|nr:SH3 domain-containing protein [Clostridia bacterium]
MAKATNKNNLLLTISAILIVIAVIITIVATVYEKNASKSPSSSETADVVSSIESTTDETKKADDGKKPETTKPETTKPETTASASSTGKTGKYTVNTQNDPLSIRLNATDDTSTIGSIPKGTEIEILAVYGDWGYVNHNGTGGWVSMKFVKFVSASTEAQKNTTGKYTVSDSGSVSIRIKAENGAPTDGSVPSGAEVEILAVCGDWGYMKYQDDMGWLPFDSLKKAA